MSDVMFPEPMDPMDRAMQRMDKKAWAEADAEIAMLKTRLASADIEATSLLMAMVQQWPDVHPDWKPLPDVAGKITQINNMVAGLRARLAEAEHLILRMAGEDYQRARFYVEKYDLTGERAAVSASVVQYKPCEICTTQSWCETHGCQCYPVSAVQPERCCLDYPRCDCNSPPEPDDDWLCFQRPAQPKVTP